MMDSTCQEKFNKEDNLQPLQNSPYRTAKSNELVSCYVSCLASSAERNMNTSFNKSVHRAELPQAGFCQSFSGSETDVSASTSTENLTHEEKYVLRNSKRQEPQGEETLDSNKSADQTSPFNTLIIHEKFDPGPSVSYFEHIQSNSANPYSVANNMQRNNQTSGVGSAPGHMNVPVSPQLLPRRTSHPPGLVPYVPNSVNSLYESGKLHCLQTDKASVSQLSYRCEPSTQEISGIPKQYLDQSQVLKHLAKEVGDLKPPPPAYPKWRNPEHGKRMSSVDTSPKLSVSRSQPDLSQIGLSSWEIKLQDKHRSPRPKTRGRASKDAGHEPTTKCASELVDQLVEENEALKAELDVCYSKVSRLQQVDLEVQKMHQSYEQLVLSSDKREILARAIRVKLEMEVKRLQDLSRELKTQLDIATLQLSKKEVHDIDDSEIRKEFNRRDLLIAQLITQNKELVGAKERQEIELAAQRATLQEQRTHIDILDSALTNAQANVVKLEEECRKKQAYVDRVNQLQKALASLQQASDKREQMEKKLRNQLEKEIQELRSQKEGKCVSRLASSEEVDELKRELREREEKLMATQAEVSKWEQRCLEESAFRQIAIDAASMPKDAKIAALEMTSLESERLIAHARSEKLKQMDELHAANKLCADMEARLKDLESKLAERDAMIRVLQKHSMEKDMVYQNAILRSPRHTPHPSIHNQLSTVTGGEESKEIASSYGAESITSCAGTSIASSGRSPRPVAGSGSSFDAASSNIDEQLKELDHQILNKDSIIQALRAEKEKYPSHFWRV